ncbi:MAG: hypothetical protein JRH01_12895 [Deltaproteobacteria bacterium]|nr:hypothetical protein [Deltaproteobacteria bacterium]MBW2396299.1 hypothetical protein [Deltaproteobacteria bacterium]
MGDDDVSHILFQGKELLALRDKGGGSSMKARSKPLTHRLNDLYRRHESVRLEVIREDAGTWISADGERILRVLPGDAAGASLEEVAKVWASQLTRALDQGASPVGRNSASSEAPR